MMKQGRLYSFYVNDITLNLYNELFLSNPSDSVPSLLACNQFPLSIFNSAVKIHV